MFRTPNLVIPSDPAVDGHWMREALAEVKYGLQTDTMGRVSNTDFAVLFSNQEFTDYVSRSRMAGDVLNFLSSRLVEYYDDVRAVAVEYGIAPPDLKDLESMEATCDAIANTDRWKAAMKTWITDNICCKHDWRLATVNDAYVVGRSMNRLLKASKRSWRATVKIDWKIVQ